MSSTITLVRFIPYKEENGHFNVLLRNQIAGCSRVGVPILFEDLSAYPQEIQLEVLFSRVDVSKTRHIYFEWLHDIPNICQLDRAFHARGLTWSVTASISELWNTNKDHSLVHKLLTELNLCKSLKTVFVFDELLIRKLNFDKILFTAIPDFESMELDSIRRPCCDWSTSSQVTIGIVGQLYGYRGVNNLISIVSKNRRLAIFLYGKGKWDSVHLVSRFILSRFVQKKRKYVSDKHLSSNAELNHAFMHLDALYIDGSRYPSPSGIVVRARNFGIPVLVEEGESYLNARSSADEGIIVGRFIRMMQKDIENSIAFGKTIPSPPRSTLIDQQAAFLEIWSKTLD